MNRNKVISLADAPECHAAVTAFYDRFRERITGIVDTLKDAWQLLLDRERINREVNSVAAAFRKMKLRKLLKMYKNQRLSKSGESGGLVRKWIMWEIWSRTPLSGICRKIMGILARIHVRVKYKWLFDMVSSVAAKYN